MAAQNKVTLTFAGDAAQLARAAKQAEASLGGFTDSEQSATRAGRDLEHQLEQTGRAAKGTKELMRGAGDAAALFGGEMGNTALQAGFAVGAVKDLSKGAAALLPKLKEITAEASALKFSLGLVVGVTGGVIAAWELGTAAGNKLNDMLGRSESAGAAWRDQVDSWTDAITNYAIALGLATDNAVNLTKAQTILDFHAESSPGAGDFMQGPVPLDATGHLLNSTNGGNTFAATQEAEKAAKAAAAALKRNGHTVGSALKSAASEAAAAAKQAAESLKQARASVADAVRGIVDAFKPKLDTTSTAGLEVGGRGASGGLIANLKKQADDTLKLRKDLEKLDKMGLDKGLLSNLVAGGLDSLPAAEDLLKGGKQEIGQANYYAGRINVRSNTIAAEQTARSLTKSDKLELGITLKSSDGTGLAQIRRLVKNNGGSVQAVLGS